MFWFALFIARGVGGCLSRLVFVKVSRQCVSVVLVIFVFSCYDIVCEFSERLVADCVQLHVVWGVRLGCQTRVSYWDVRLGCQIVESGWDVRLRCQAGVPDWGVSLGVRLWCQTGMSG